jgi:hypothetical protein
VTFKINNRNTLSDSDQLEGRNDYGPASRSSPNGTPRRGRGGGPFAGTFGQWNGN